MTIIGQTPMVLVVNKDVPATDYKSLLAYIKAHPSELTFASNGRGSAGHLAGSLFKKMAGTDIRYIPYRTTPQATADLIGGRISMIWLSSLGNLAGTDAVRPFGVTMAGERWNQFPDVPTFDELGLKDYESPPGSACMRRRVRPRRSPKARPPPSTRRSPTPRCGRASTSRHRQAARHGACVPAKISERRDREVGRHPSHHQGHRLGATPFPARSTAS